MAEVAKLHISVATDANKAEQDLRSLDKTIEQTGGGADRLGAVMGGAVAAGAIALTGAVAGLGAGLASSVSTAANFEEQMSGVQAVLGLSADAMEPLNDLAMELGSTTQFSAQQAAAGIEMLAKNGLDMEDILGGAAQASLDLAAATGSDLATAANVATDVTAQFGMEAADLATAIDGITAVTTASKFDINDYSLALANGGSAAASAGLSFDDFNVAIAGIASQFDSGMTAGTAMKNLLNRLTPNTQVAADAMRELGLITEDGTNQFYNADGSLKELHEIAGLMQGALAGLSEEQRSAAIETIFGNDALGAAIGLMNQGEAGILALSSAMGETSAAEQAATRMDNFAGQVKLLQSALETLQIQIGQALLPVLTMLLRDAVIPFVQWIGPHLVAAAEMAAGWITKLSEGGGGLGETLQQVWTALQPLVAAFGQFGQALASAFQQLMGGDTGGALMGILAAFGDLRTALLGLLLGMVPDIIATLEQWSLAFLNWLPGALPGILQTIATSVQQLTAVLIQHAPAIAAALIHWGQAMVQWAVDAWPGLSVQLGLLVQQLVTWIMQQAPILLQQAAVWGQQLIAGIAQAFPGISEKLTAIQQLWDGLSAYVTGVVTALSAAVMGILQALGVSIQANQGETVTWFQTTWDTIQQIVSVAWDVIVAVVQTSLDILNATVVPVLESIASFIQANQESLTAIFDGVWQTITGIIDAALAVILGLLETASAVMSGDWDAAWQAILKMTDGVIKGLVKAIEGLATAWLGQIELLSRGMIDGFGGIWTAVTRGIGAFVGDAVRELGNGIQKLIGVLKGVMTSMLNAGKAIGKSLAMGIANGFGDAIGGVVEKIKGTVSKITDGLKNKLKIKSPSGVTYEEVGIPTGEGPVEGAIHALRQGTPRLAQAMRDMAGSIPAPSIPGPTITPGISAMPAAPQADAFGNIMDLLKTGDFGGGIFGMYEDDALVTGLLDLSEALREQSTSEWDFANNLQNVSDLLASGDYTKGILGMYEDNPLLQPLYELSDMLQMSAPTQQALQSSPRPATQATATPSASVSVGTLSIQQQAGESDTATAQRVADQVLELLRRGVSQIAVEGIA